MINKKLLAVASVAAVLSTSSAFAKTEGSYVGLDLLRSSTSFQYHYGNGVKDPKVGDEAGGVGVNYKYAFNMNNFFIAPGVFAEMNGVNATKNWDSTVQETFKINERYGLKADFGYDISDNFAAYVTGGVSRVNYEYEYVTTTSNKRIKGNEVGYLYGLGLMYKVNKDVGLNVEYNTQSTDLKSAFAADKKIKSDLSVIKVGASYHF